MSTNNKKTIPFLRATACTTLIAIWCMWIINSEEVKIVKEPSTKQVAINTEESIVSSKENSITLETTKQSIADGNGQKVSYKPQAINKDDLPKLVNLMTAQKSMIINPEKSDEKSQVPKTKKEDLNIESTEKISVNLELPDAAHETRKILLDKKNTLVADNTPLREKVYIKKNEPNPFNEIELSWLPKYITEKKELKAKITSAINNLDIIANQLELAGLLPGKNGPTAAIIRNKTDNMVEILKIGEEYQGLELLEIEENKIILGNKNLNKKYTKQLASSN